MAALTGRIGLITEHAGKWPTIIRLVTRSPYTHAVIALDDQWCISAELPHVIRQPIATYRNIHWMPPLGTPEQMSSVAWHANAMAEAKVPYNRLAFALAGLASLGINPPAWLRNWATGCGLTCSMACDQAHAAAGIDLIGDPVTTWPGRLADNVRGTVYWQMDERAAEAVVEDVAGRLDETPA
jgi:hypothetical protein